MKKEQVSESELERNSGDDVLKSGVFLVGVSEAGPGDGAADARRFLAELRELVTTLNYPIAGEMIAPARRQPDPRYFIGSGKAEEIRSAAHAAHAEMIVFDSELGASQQRNLEKLCELKVLARQEIILDIFAARARTREAVLQVELARNRYFLPRLTRAWSHLSRQRGGAMGTRGEGEKQIEYDRRMVKQHISKLEAELSEVRKQRSIQRKNRLRNALPLGSIVGYTNAGKSSLLNLLTGADAYVEDKLFATLDPTTRKLVLPDKTAMLLTDTVGFVRKLPHTLIEAFKSTLEEAVLADFLVLVLDISNPEVESHWETTLSVLSELQAQEKPMLIVFNKCDLQPDPLIRTRLRSLARDSVFLSCRDRSGMDDLLGKLAEYCRQRSRIEDLRIPASRSDAVARIYAKTSLLESEYLEDGTFCCTVRIPGTELEFFRPFFRNQSEC